jgi:actin-related protein
MAATSVMGAAVVLDPGSHVIRSGFAGDGAPRAMFPPIVGRTRGHGLPVVEMGQKDAFVGEEAQAGKGAFLACNRPLKGGVVTNWDDMEKILWHNFYQELRVASEDQPFLLAEPVMAPPRQRERFSELLFETFSVPRYATVVNCMLDVFGSGHVEALVVSIGATQGFVCGTAVLGADEVEFNDYRLAAAPRRLPVQGKHVTDYLARVLADRRSYSFATTSEMDIVRDVKEQLCFVATDGGAAKEASYELPDGQQIFVAEERYLAPEVMFDPSLVEERGLGVSDAVAEYLESCSGELQKRLAANVVLSGGGTMFPGFKQRLQSDLAKYNCQIVTPRASRMVKQHLGCVRLFVVPHFF